MTREFTLPVRVYIEDTDAGGIVYYVNYLKFMERGRTEFMRELGFDKPAVLDQGNLLVVHSLTTSYRKPARLDDLLSVTTSITKLARTNLVFHQVISKDGEVMCEADVRVACVEQEAMKPAAIPEAMLSRIKQIVE